MSRYKVWYTPQVPMRAFEVQVDSLEVARLIERTLCEFSLFEYENHVKPDYADAGGICELDEDGDWVDVCDEETS